jgi:hypothetical protein
MLIEAATQPAPIPPNERATSAQRPSSETSAEVPCARGVEQGVGYRFNLQTHCGIEWAYFNGRYWVPNPMIDAPSHWANITAGTMVLERSGIAVFEADEGGGARFVPAPTSYRPPVCM